MYRWLADNINYPASTIDTGRQFKIIVQFEISVAGKIENIIFIKNVEYLSFVRKSFV